ncbi:MAG: 2-oxoacid:acceptor oxidoreductase subunit alpha [candidate division WOR-3 bacterium]|uniref:2-oxoacid:acceptor oxidoreductase subunit alpha n=1 Tax=candidate division WOR-3 bacterium TaxID=2052148 RepID=A0A7V4ABH0_UNCW3
MKAKILTGTHYMLGDHACAEGAIAAGCRFFAGYPITPSTEIAEWISRRLPLFGGIYIQMEDEIASITALIGASCGGVKSMTATSGPGYSLMVEGIGLAVMLEVPCVIVNVQRGAPSTGLPTLVGQGDVMQARWGSHGDYEIIALAPNSCQEMFDLTIKAFNLSEKYRVPVTILSDEAVGHLREKVVIPPEEKIEIIDRKKPNVPPEEYWPYIPDEDLVPPMAIAGEGYFVHMTGLTHDERGYPDITGEAHERLVRRLIDKIQKNRKDIIEYEEVMLDDAEIVVVSFGITARAALKAVREARKKGIKAGLFRLITIWPFPEERIAEISKKIEKFVVAEINQGQVRREVERARVNSVPVIGVHKLGGELITPDEILEGIWKKQN